MLVKLTQICSIIKLEKKMKKVYGKMEKFFEELPTQLRNIRYFVWILILLITAIMILGATKIKTTRSADAAFPESDQALQILNKYKQEFGSNENLTILFKAKNGDVFSQKSLNVLSDLQKELEAGRYKNLENGPAPLSHIVEIKSILNASYEEVDGDTLKYRKFIGSDIPQEKGHLENLRSLATNHRDYPGLYFSKDYKFGIIHIRTDFGTTPEGEEDNQNDLDEFESEAEDDEVATDFVEMESQDIQFKSTDNMEYAAFMNDIEKILQNPKYTQEMEFHGVGFPVIVAFIVKVLSSEFAMIFAGLGLIVLIAQWGLFRSFSAVVWPLSIVIITLIWTSGLIGWSGVVLRDLLQAIKLLTIVVGISDSIHILSGYVYFRSQKNDHTQALQSALKKSGIACLLTSLTTMIGFGSLIFVPLKELQYFGIFCSISVGIAYLLTIFLLPLMIDIWRPISKKKMAKIQQNIEFKNLAQLLLSKVDCFTQKNAKLIATVFIAIFIFCGWGAVQISIDKNIIEDFQKNSSVTKAFKIFEKATGGSQNLQVFIDTGVEGGLKDPEMLVAMDTLQKQLEQKYSPLVVRSMSLANIVKNTYQALNENNPQKYVIPKNKKVLTETLFLFNNSKPEDRRQLVSDNYQKASINLSIKNDRYSKYAELIENVEKEKDLIFSALSKKYPDLTVNLTGSIRMIVQEQLYSSQSLLSSFLLTLAVISLILLVLFGSIRVGLFVAMIPNLFPVVITFGIMGWLKIPLDSFTLIITPIIIGISVDDTIHFLTHYRIEVANTGSISSALTNTIKEVGQAVSFTSIILGFGLLSMAYASFVPMARFGLLSGFAIFSALLADLFLLPALCILFNVQFKKNSVGKKSIITKPGFEASKNIFEN
jgi:uncharacterized protein